MWGAKQSFLQDYSVDVRKTNAVLIPDFAKQVGLMIPSISDGDVGIEVYEAGDTAIEDIDADDLLASADTNWNPVLDLADGQDAVICASSYDPGFVEITDLVGSLKGQYIRFTIGGDQSEDSTWYLYFK